MHARLRKVSGAAESAEADLATLHTRRDALGVRVRTLGPSEAHTRSVNTKGCSLGRIPGHQETQNVPFNSTVQRPSIFFMSTTSPSPSVRPFWYSV